MSDEGLPLRGAALPVCTDALVGHDSGYGGVAVVEEIAVGHFPVLNLSVEKHEVEKHLTAELPL